MLLEYLRWSYTKKIDLALSLSVHHLGTTIIMNIPPKYFPILLIILACLVRIVYFYQFQANPFSNHLPELWDQTLYHEGAKALIEGDPFANGFDGPNQQSPFYQYFLGLVYFFFGVELVSAWITQLILGVISTVLLYTIAKHYMSQGSAFTAGIIFTFYGGNWFYECTLYRASLITFLVLLTYLLLLRFGERPSIGLLVGSALSLSFLTQARTNLIFFVPFALVYLWRKVFSLNNTGKKWLAGFLVIFFLASLPLLIWVKQIHGHWGLYDQTGGENLYLANSPDYPVRSVVHDNEYRKLLTSERLGSIPALQLILNDIAERPLEVTKVYLKKVYYYFNNYEVPTTHNYYLSSELSPVLSWGSIPFGVIASLGVSGFFWSWIAWKRLTLLHAFFLGNLIAYLPFFIFSRYRLSMVPFLCIFSAFILQVIYQRFQIRELRVFSLVLILVFALGFFVKTVPLPEGKIRILDYINLSSAYLNNDKPDDDNKAYNYLKRSWDLSQSLPADSRNTKVISMALSHFYFRKSDFFQHKKDTVRESIALQTAISFDFSSSSLHARYARNLIQKGEPEKALLESLIALNLEPNSFDLNLLLGEVYIIERSYPLWGLYHLLQASSVSKLPLSSSLENSIQNLQGALKLNLLPTDLKKLNLKVKDLLTREVSSLKSFLKNPFLPVEATKWTREKLYNYRLKLHQYLLFERRINPALIYYQLGMLEFTFFNNDNAAFYYLEKSWDHGLRAQQLASLLNDLLEKLATRSIS